MQQRHAEQNKSLSLCFQTPQHNTTMIALVPTLTGQLIAFLYILLGGITLTRVLSVLQVRDPFVAVVLTFLFYG